MSASRFAGALHFGQETFTQSLAAPSGDEPLGFKSKPAALGNCTGS